ncbi:MAG: hypothetical protein MI748_11140 [Opitutales bacterium]|nr:hypothetical protein [Opitutales bacterium]
MAPVFVSKMGVFLFLIPGLSAFSAVEEPAFVVGEIKVPFYVFRRELAREFSNLPSASTIEIEQVRAWLEEWTRKLMIVNDLLANSKVDEAAVAKAVQVVGDYMLIASRNSLYNRTFHGDLLLNDDLVEGEVYDLTKLRIWLADYNMKKTDRNRIRLLRNVIRERNQQILERAQIKWNEPQLRSLSPDQLLGDSQEKIDFPDDGEWICKYSNNGRQLKLDVSEIVDFYNGSMVRRKIDSEESFRDLVKEYVVCLCKVSQLEDLNSIEKEFYKFEEEFFRYNTIYNLYIDELRHSKSAFVESGIMEIYENITEKCDSVFEVEFFWFNDRRSAEFSRQGKAVRGTTKLLTVSVYDEHYEDVLLELCRIEENRKSVVYKKDGKYFYFVKRAGSNPRKIPFTLIRNEMEEQLMEDTVSGHLELYLKTLRDDVSVWYCDQISWIWE